MYSPLGQSLLPLINSFFGNRNAPVTNNIHRNNVIAPVSSILPQPVPSQQSTLNTMNGSLVTATTTKISSPGALKEYIAAHRATVLFFSSETCKPCHVIEPEFEKYIKLHGKLVIGTWNAGTDEPSTMLGAVKVDIGGESASIALSYSILAAPTFITLCEGKKVLDLFFRLIL